MESASQRGWIMSDATIRCPLTLHPSSANKTLRRRWGFRVGRKDGPGWPGINVSGREREERSNLFHRSAANSTVSGYAREYPGLRSDRIARTLAWLWFFTRRAGRLTPIRLACASIGPSQRKLAQYLTYCAR